MTENNYAFLIGGKWRAPTSRVMTTEESPNDVHVVWHGPEDAEADVDAAGRALDDPTG
ncbi:hypothetical protein QLG13_22230 [Rhodococcus aetherivorans]|uniref:Uncharacterized protein n=1 Tax=Rhodococcus aetherivorans TaxID=191292 RepID=A0AA46SAU3_9NOCA|nr:MULTISPECIES: hypothetical protein [Rhodococcus]MDV6294030.1 hypothetical protein [Rhodococcus aetherivorans]USC14389.1 hypothetical protein KZJ41_22565 [Rhodococcus sp. 11-3]UYF95540.1 hypothetical protein OCS65_07205 [Rhodococcus aetherivorans]WFS15831.1 hypothetical protein P9K37_12645 [Rhodococcus aetherivorans]WKW97715.1 hypothetical protein Q3O43_22205 [Rhodococcus aetherivorans]